MATILREPFTVAGSLLIAIMATYIALEFAGRLREARDQVSAWLWMGAGSVTMGSGLWAMHFVGMSAATYPFEANYGEGATVVSWMVAIAITAVVLATARVQHLRWWALTAVSVAGGLGATGMHFVGMAAMHVAPAPTVRFAWIAAAVTTAAVGVWVGLAFFHRVVLPSGGRRVLGQAAAATVVGAALAGMHYLSMAATWFADDTVVTSRDGLDVDRLGNALAFATVMGLLIVFVVSVLERRATDHASRIRASLDNVRAKLEFVTFNDAVTGLPNRLVFDDRLRQAVARCERSGESIAVLFVGFGTVADLGLANGGQPDAAMRRMADRLSEVARAADTVACIGAGHFLVMISGAEPAETALQIAERLRAEAADASPERLPSIGVAVYPRDGGVDDLVRNANAAFVAVEREGGNDLRFFEASMDEEARTRSAWLVDLREAVRHEQFELHYQPKMFAKTGTIAGVEALIRWTHPVRGRVGPADFIAVAERHGLIDEIGGWVVREACRQMRCWHDQGLRVRVAVNVSPQQLRRPDLADEILAALKASDVDPTLLTCEVTESAAMNDPLVSAAVFDRLCAAGVQIAIDDFGTGYSSLSQLRRMPVRQLKIDRSFVKDLEHSDDARAIVQAIVQMAHTLRLEVVAEGVETEGQRLILLASGCDKLQGFLFARPMSAARVSALLQGRRPDFDPTNLLAA